MNKEQVLEIIENSFMHLQYEKNIKVGNIEVLIYFPTAGVAVLESSKDVKSDEDVVDFKEAMIRKELSAEPIYLDMHDDNFNIGYVINDILLTAEFVPTIEIDINENDGKHM